MRWPAVRQAKLRRELIDLADHALQQDRHHRKAAQGYARD
jgi:hypothetical protein